MRVIYSSNGREIDSTHQTESTAVSSWGLGKSPASNVSTSKDHHSKLHRDVKNVISRRKVEEERALCWGRCKVM